MASLAAYSDKKKLKIARTSHFLDLKGWELIPPHFLQAMQNALKAEIKTAKTLPNLGEIKQKVFEQKKARTRRISFGDVKEHSKNKIQERKICFETKPKEMASCLLMDHFPSAIEELMTKNFTIKQAREQAHGIQNLLLDTKIWGPAIIGSTHESLVKEASFSDIPMEIVKNDLKKIYKYCRKETVAILGYKTSYKMPYKRKELVYNSYKGEWEWTGNWVWMAPNLRLYIIKVVKDEDFCATLIQTVWRQRRDKKILRLLKGFSNLASFFAGKRGDLLAFAMNR